MPMSQETFSLKGKGHSMQPYRQHLIALINLAAFLAAAPWLHAQDVAPAPGTASGVGTAAGQNTQSGANAAPTPNLNLAPYGNTQWYPSFWEPYGMPYVPETKMSNSDRLHYLLSDGILRLSLEDTIELALENNLDIAVARYSIAFSQTDVLRAQGGGAARGFTGSFQSGALFAGAVGTGVSATTSAPTSGGSTISGSASAIQLGGGTFDPTAFVSFGWDRNTTPLGTTAVTGVPYVTSQGTSYVGGVVQEFQSGTSYEVLLGGGRGTSTSLTQFYNPFVDAFVGVGFTQPLLNGYGKRANSTQIRIAKNDMKVADSVFRQQVITTLGAILNEYWDYLSFKENVRVKEQAVAFSQKLLADNKKQVEIGTLAPIEVVRAESELATDQQALIVAQTNLQQQGELMKTALARQVDPALAAAQIDTADKLPSPRPDDVPSLDKALRLAFSNRPEIEQTQLKFRDQDLTIELRKNGLLPSLNVYGTYIAQGLSGNRLVCPDSSSPYGTTCLEASGSMLSPTGTTSGGDAQALSQTFEGHYPNYSFGINLSVPIRNRTAQADAARALLERRQLETQLQQWKNNIAQQVRTALIGVIQAKAQIDAADKATYLARQTLEAEQKKFQLGESTVFLVIQSQRDLANAQGNAVTGHSTYAKAITQYQQAVGTILADYNVELNDAVQGTVTHVPNIPGSADTPKPVKLN
jgi:outer membrane protein